MRILIHDEHHEVPQDLTVAALLRHLGLEAAACAVAVNADFVPRGAHAHHALREDDRVDILAPMQGG